MIFKPDDPLSYFYSHRKIPLQVCAFLGGKSECMAFFRKCLLEGLQRIRFEQILFQEERLSSVLESGVLPGATNIDELTGIIYIMWKE